MNEVDISRPVKLRRPLPGEEGIIYEVSSLNDETGRCYIAAMNLKGFGLFRPIELVSIDDIENV